MAHECPTCGNTCHCNEDIDDVYSQSGVCMCSHCDEDDPEGASPPEDNKAGRDYEQTKRGGQ